MRGTHHKSLLLAACLSGLALGAQAAPLSVTSAGLGPLNFNTAPLVDEFATAVLPGGGATYVGDAAMDAGAQTVNAATVVTPLPQDGTVPPAASSLGMRYNNNAAGLYIQSRPTTSSTNAAGVMVAFLQNNTGGALAAFEVRYSFQTSAVLANEDVRGFRVFYSPDGTPGSWVLITGLSGNETAGTHAAVVTPSLPIAPGSLFYLLWADDNDDGDTDPGYIIDNFQILANLTPTIVTQPAANTAVNERQVAALSVAATGAGLSYQWTKGGVPIAGATANTLSVTNIDATDVVDGHGTSKYPWSNPGDSGTYRVIVSGTAGAPVTSDAAVVTVTADTTPPAFSYAICGTNLAGSETMLLVMSEPLNDSNGAVTDSSNWEIKTTDNSSSLGAPSAITYLDDGVNRTIVFSLNPLLPRDPAKGYKVILTAIGSLDDTAKSANVLNGTASVGAFCFTNQLLALGATWRYNDTGADLGPTWYTGDDSTLPSTGIGPFHANRTVPCPANIQAGPAVGTCTVYSNAATLSFRTNHYFRTHFTYSGTPGLVPLQIETYIDDGAVIYVNGTEFERPGMNPGPTSNITIANRTTNGEYEKFLHPQVSLVNDNVIAVEAHQVSAGSSDLTWGGIVSSLSVEPPVAAPVLSIALAGANVSITSTISGTLISSTSITAPRSGWTVEGPITGGTPLLVPRPGPQKFFAVKVP